MSAPPPIVGPIHPRLFAALVEAHGWAIEHHPAGPLPEVLVGHVERTWGWNRVRHWLGCAPIHKLVSDSWPALSLLGYAAGMRR